MSEMKLERGGENGNLVDRRNRRFEASPNGKRKWQAWQGLGC